MRLQKLSLRNFKGCKAFTLEPGGDDCSVFGDNGTGKTTLADALAWLLTGKDSRGNAPGTKEFQIKPLSADGAAASGLECEVEAEFDGGLTLRKTYKEVWTKKRGAAAAEFGGNTVDHVVNGVPVQEKEYLSQVEKVAPAKAIRLLTSPSYFPETLPWKERRALLLDVCGDVTDADVIASTPELAELPEILGKHSQDDYRKIVAARRTEINRRQVEIPARIDELNRTLQGVIFDPTEDEVHLSGLRQKRQDLEQTKAQLSAGGAEVELTGQMRSAELAVTRIKGQLETEAATARRRAEDAAAAHRREAEGPVDIARATLRGHRSILQETRDNTASWTRQKAALEQANAESRDAYNALAASDWSGSETCPACSQPLPAEKIEDARAAWNETKSTRMERIKTESLNRRGEIDTLAAKLAQAELDARSIEEDIRLAEAALQEAETHLAAVKAEALPVIEAVETQELRDAKDAVVDLMDRLKSARVDTAPEAARIDRELAIVDADVRATQGRIAAAAEGAKAQTRIEELQAEQRALGAEFERLESHLALLDLFLKTKVSLLEDSINGHFQVARFKLFNQQVNGGLEPCCEVTVNGVPFGCANTGSRLNVGLDIIRTLGKHFGVSLPVVCDNAESVTRLLEIPAQVIRLVVSENDKTLRVEADQRYVIAA